MVSRLILGACGMAGLVMLGWAAARLLTMLFRREKQKPAEKSAYRFEDFLEDLKNPAIQIDTIIQKCGGTIPREWEERIGPADPAVKVEPPVSPPADKAGVNRYQEWFSALAQKTPTIKVVPPPPPERPQLQGWLIPCKWCVEMNTGMGGRYLKDRYGNHLSPPCDRCNNTRMIMITGGGYRGGK